MICDYGTLEERKLQLKTEDDGQYFDFEFPPQIFKTKTFKHPFDVWRELVRAGIKVFFRRGKLFLRAECKIDEFNYKTKFFCKYRECPAKLIYLRNPKHKENDMQLLVFKNLHSHKKSKDPEKAKRQQVNSFIFNLSGKDWQSYRNIRHWMERFDLSSREALYIVDQLYWANNTEDEILTRLAYDGNCIRRVREQGETMLIYLRTNNMKNNFLQYGETVNVELNYDTLRKPTPFGNKYAVIHFYGQDQNLRLILFSVAIIAKESVPNFTKLFQFFLDNTCDSTPPLCFITDEIKTLTIALKNVKKARRLSFSHLYSWGHVIENLKPILKSIKQGPNGKGIMDMMCRAMQQFHERTYQALLKELSVMLRGRQDIMKEFLSKQHQICCRRMPQYFIGYAITTMFAEQVNRRTTTTTVYRVHTGRLFYKLIEIEKILHREINKVSVINTGIIKHYPADINFFQNKIEARLMDVLVRNYSDSKDWKKVRLDTLTFKVKNDRQNKHFICRFLIEYDHWQCECNHLVLVGIPCCHLISVIVDPDISGSLMYYINSRWIHDKQDIISEHAKPFITNKKRRP